MPCQPPSSQPAATVAATTWSAAGRGPSPAPTASASSPAPVRWPTAEYAGRKARCGGWGELIGDEGLRLLDRARGHEPVLAHERRPHRARARCTGWCASASASTNDLYLSFAHLGRVRTGATRSRSSRGWCTRPRRPATSRLRQSSCAARANSSPASWRRTVRSAHRRHADAGVAQRRRVRQCPADGGCLPRRPRGVARAARVPRAAVPARGRRRALCGPARRVAAVRARWQALQQTMRNASGACR